MLSTLSVIELLLFIIISVIMIEINSTDVTFEELVHMKIKLNEQSSCKERMSIAIDQLSESISCHCDSPCSTLGTCCWDSPFRELNRTTEVANCRSINGQYSKQEYFIIDKCPFNGNTNDAFHKQCEEEGNSQDDLMSRVPVTSLSSKLTYKNYFCFRCHESSEDYVFWNVEWSSNIYFYSDDYKGVIPIYNNENRRWLAAIGKDGALIPVKIRLPDVLSSEGKEFEERFFIIDKCSCDCNVLRNWCEEETNTEADIKWRVPVTSISSKLTYRNYFCFRCHEASDDYVFWFIHSQLNIQFDNSQYKDVIPTYNKDKGKWLAPMGKDGELLPVKIRIVVPPEISNLPRTCFSNLISNCSENWPEDEIRRNCGMYMYLAYVYRDYYSTNVYRNPHCALCNFEHFETISRTMPKSGGGVFPVSSPGGGRLFSFTLLLDINQSDGGKVGKIPRCGHGFTWDPFYRKCRRLGCAFPGYIIRDGKCRAP